MGYGLEGVITDSMKVNIGDRIIVPNFRNEDYGKGIYESMVVIEGLIEGNEEVISRYSMQPTGQSNDGESSIWSFLFFALIFVLFVLVPRKGRHGRRGMGGTYIGGFGGGFGGGMSGSGGFGGFGGGMSGGGGFGGSW